MKRYRTVLQIIDVKINLSHTYIHSFRTMKAAKSYKQRLVDSINDDTVTVKMTIYEKNN